MFVSSFTPGNSGVPVFNPPTFIVGVAIINAPSQKTAPADTPNVGGYANWNYHPASPSFNPPYSDLTPKNHVATVASRPSSTGITLLREFYRTPTGLESYRGVKGVGTMTSRTTLRA